jgi:tetratricopeptide (TPR) repeat protein
LAVAVVLIAGCGGSPEERAQSYYDSGMKLLSQKDYVKASVELKNALQIKNNHVGAMRALAQIEEQNQNWGSLVPVLRSIVKLDLKDIESRLRLARFMFLANALDESLKLTDEAVELNDRHAGALALRAAIFLKLNDNAGAVREAQKALEIDPGSVDALIVLAAERVSRGDPEGALLILDRSSVADAQNFGIQLFKIKIFEQLGNTKQVETLLRKVSELYPQEALFRRQLVKLYIDQKRLDDAEKELRAIAAANPGNLEAGLDVVRFLLTAKGADAARQELLTRVNAGGSAFGYQIALAEFHFAQGNVTDSIQLLESLIRNESSPENILAAQTKLAELHLSKKKLDASEALVADILRKDARNTGGLKLRALIRMERGQFEPAISDLRQALNDQSRSTDLMLLLALAYERNGAIELADKQFADATRISGFDANVGLSYVNFLQRRGGTARAEDILIELTSRSPNNVQLLTMLAQVKLTRQDWAGAQEIAETIRRIGNNPGVADQILGVALSGRNKIDESIGALQNAYTAAPTAVQPMYALVRVLVRAQKMEQATSFLKSVLEKNPTNAEAHVLLGSVQLLSKAPDQALKSFQAAIEQQPRNIVGYKALADFYFGQKNSEEARKVIRAGLKEQPGNFTLRMTLAGDLELKGDYEAAIVEYESILAEQPGSMIVANNLASLIADHRTDKASLERAYSISAMLKKSQIPQFKDTIGWVYYQRGEHKAAVSLLEEAATDLPSLALVRYHLGMGYIATGQNEKAAEQLRKALELASDDRGLEEKIRMAMKKAGIT